MTGAPLPGTAALVLAAGFSSRMGAFKPLLPLGESTVLAHVVQSCRAAGVEHILAVSGREAAALEAETARLDIAVTHNPRYAEGMFSSVCAGLAALPPVRRVFILPVDIPLVRSQTLRRLAAETGETPVLLPEFDGRAGHPPLISRDIVPDILNWQGEGGLKHALTKHACRRVAVADRAVLLDMDTPDAYDHIRSRFERLDAPDPGEAEALLRLHGVPDRGVAHGRAVAAVAVALTDALRENVPSLNREFIEAAAFLHDIAKGQPRHEETGGALLAELGFPRLGAITARHRDCAPENDAPLTETHLVYFADKLVRGPFRVPLEQRFAEKLAQYPHDNAARAAILRRLNNARRMQARLEQTLGYPVEDALKGLDVPWAPEAKTGGSHA